MSLIGMIDFNKIELVVCTLVNAVTINYRRLSYHKHYEICTAENFVKRAVKVTAKMYWWYWSIL